MCVPAAIWAGSSENLRLGVRRIDRTRSRFWLAYHSLAVNNKTWALGIATIHARSLLTNSNSPDAAATWSLSSFKYVRSF